MSTLSELQSARRKKLEMLREAFGEVYPARALLTHTIHKVLERFSQFSRSKKILTIAGRVRAIRPHGGAIFFDLEENGELVQGYLRKEEINSELFRLFTDDIDIGDIVEITGKAYLTKRKEKSVLISRWRPLAKSLRPLPEKWHGLADQEERYRTRALDLLSNTRARKIFTVRSSAISFIRSYLEKLEFLEFDTPVLQPLAGGATARPFVTHHNALDIDLYLRIAPELYLKRLLVGGYSRVFEIARNFRNEGIDITHNPEFTMLEAYMAYADYEMLMKHVEQLMKKLLQYIFKKKEFVFGEKTITYAKPFKRISFFDSLRQYALLPHVHTMTAEDLIIAAKRFGLAAGNTTRAGLLDDIFRKAVRPHFVQPTFVVDWPRELLPLAKRSAENPDITESFQLYIGGIELVKGFSELNDPRDQMERFNEQEELRRRGNDEAQRIDADYIENLEYGLPPAAGFGMGIDRLMLLLTNTHNIREVILFPTLRPK